MTRRQVVRKPKRVRKPKLPRRAETVCNGCGCCCDPVLLPYTQFEARSMNIAPDNMRWTLEDLTPMHPREARRLAPWYFQSDKNLVGLTPEESVPFFYRCRHFNRETRECMDYDNRPDVCRIYPKLNGIMVMPGTALPDPCSFNVDLGIEPTPVDEYLARIRQPS